MSKRLPTQTNSQAFKQHHGGKEGTLEAIFAFKYLVMTQSSFMDQTELSIVSLWDADSFDYDSETPSEDERWLRVVLAESRTLKPPYHQPHFQTKHSLDRFLTQAQFRSLFIIQGLSPANGISSSPPPRIISCPETLEHEILIEKEQDVTWRVVAM